MARENQIQMLKTEVICPFCLERTGKWKFFRCKWEYNYNKTQLYLEAVNKIEANNFERNVLQNHLKDCAYKDILSESILTIYKLEK